MENVLGESVLLIQFLQLVDQRQLQHQSRHVVVRGSGVIVIGCVVLVFFVTAMSGVRSRSLLTLQPQNQVQHQPKHQLQELVVRLEL